MKKKNLLFPFYGGLLKKLWRIMKITLLLMIIGIFTVSAKVFSQDCTISVKLQNGSLSDLFKVVEQKTEYRIFYKTQLVEDAKKINVDVSQELLSDLLTNVLSERSLSYDLIDKVIVITPTSDNKEFQQQKKNIVTGKITDNSGMPMTGVTVSIKGTTKAVISNEKGIYSIPITEKDNALIFTFIGMKMQEIAIEGRSVINVVLESAASTLEEVIVVGYGSKKKRDLTGSISSLSAKTLVESHSESFVQALQGKVAGVYVKSNSGQPGGGVSVRIRGIGGVNNSEPLYVIDGIQMGGGTDDSYNSLAAINPNDIESMEILKDASSSAIYGARGANGVVLITTKRGAEGKPKFSYSGTFGIQNLSNPNNFGVLNAQEYATVVNATVQGDGGVAVFGANTAQYPLTYFPAPSSLGAGTNWLSAIIHKDAPTQEHQLSVSGGSPNHKYYLSLNYLDENGIIINTSFKRYSIRLNTDNTVNKLLKIGNSLVVSNSSSNYIGSTRSGEGGMYLNTLIYAPTIPLYNADGTYAGPPTAFYPPTRNPVSNILSNNRENLRTDILGNVYGDLSIFKGLSFKTSLSISLNMANSGTFTPIYAEGIATNPLSSVSSGSSKTSGWNWSNVLSYFTDLGKHHISSLIGTEANESKYNSIAASATNTDNAVQVVSTLGSTTSNVSQSISSSSMISYFGNLSYNYANKYYLEGNIRRDGSSKFGVNSRWGLFPSFSSAWRISQEGFFPKGVVNELKLRASYGMVGNDKIGDFAYIAALKNVLYAFGGVNGSFSNGLAINALANPDLKWETSTQMNFGFDLGLFNNKLYFTTEYFETKVSDMLIGLPIPAVTGISSSTSIPILGTVMSNVGSLTNKGIEFEASYKDQIGKLSYTIGANLTTFNNKVTSIGNNAQIWGQTYQSMNVSRSVVGGGLGEFYGYVVDGIFQTQAEVDAANALGDPAIPFQATKTAPGDFKFKDLNGDNVINDKDREVIGSPIPKFTYGFNLDLAYENFEITMLLTGSHGNDIYDANRMDLEASGRTNFNKSKTVLNAWSGPNTSNKVPRRIASDPNMNKRISSVFVEDGSYCSLRNIQLSYNLPEFINSKFKFSSSKVFISGQNLFTLTKYSGMDPEIGDVSGSNLSSGIDNDVFPHSKSFHLGILINF